MTEWIASREGHARAILRFIMAFVIFLHGLHKVFGLFELGGRRGNPVVALETLPAAVGYFELAAGLLLLVGLYVRPIAALLVMETVYAYISAGIPHGILPMRNSAQEATIQGVIYLLFAVAGAGAWSLDSRTAPDKQTGGNKLDEWTPVVFAFARVALAMLFFQHGFEKFSPPSTGRVGPPMAFLGQRWFSAVLEFGGGSMLALGLFTRPLAFLLCGEMAVAYFSSWVRQGKWIPITGSEEAVMFCYAFLWLVAAGGGKFSVDAWIAKLRHKSPDAGAAPEARAV